MLLSTMLVLTSTDGSTRTPKQPVMEHADEAILVLSPYLSIFLAQRAGKLPGLRRPTQMVTGELG